MDACPALAPDAGFVRSMLAFVDCQAETLGASGFQALAAPGSTLAIFLTGALILVVALFGYRLLFGHGPNVSTAVLTFAKIGIVLALATSWPAYRTLVYDVTLRGPGEFASEIGAPAGADLVDRLDVADQALAAVATLGEGSPPVATNANQPAAPGVTPPQPYPGFNALALGGARMIFLMGAIGALAAARLVAGLMLALGPFFIAFLLFEGTRSLFEGWVRVLAGAALAALGTAVALGVELALLEPRLADILSRRGANEWLPAMPVELLVVTAIFALLILALFAGSAKVALGFRLAPAWRSTPARVVAALRAEEVRAGTTAAAPPAEARSRAAALADAVAATQRREVTRDVGRPVPSGRAPAPLRMAFAGPVRDGAAPVPPAPLGQSFRRRTRGRVSASADRRDRAS